MKFPHHWTVLLVFACTLFASSTHVSAQCSGRVRKDWDSLSSSEKATYRGAIGAAMDSGAYIKFVEVHTEMMSEMEAHRQCMFIYWHRLLLVVFENMLRGQGSQYACVTIPYWDWVSAHARMTNGQCRSMADCSPILTELGGVPSGSQQSQLAINGIQTQGYCVSADPVDHFCQSSSARTSNQCARCVPRGAWGSVTFPGSASLASVRSQLFSSRTIAEMSTAIETGAHDAVHAGLGGAMETFASNSDPIFYSHHAMVDLLHVTFHHCRAGDAMLTLQQKAQSSVGWSSCQRRGGGVFNPLDTVLMRTGEGGANPSYIGQDAIIGRYFQDVPNQYAALMDIRDLGASSYSYELSGVLGNMYTNCDGSPAGTPAPPASVPQPSTAGGIRFPFINIGFGNGPISQGISSVVGRIFGRGRRALRSQDSYSDSSASPSQSSDESYNPTPSPTPRASTKSSSSYNFASPAASSVSSASTSTSSSSTSTTSAASIVTTTTNTYVKKTEAWCDDTEKQVEASLSSNPTLAKTTSSIVEVEKMMCMFQDQCLGGVQDYSESFKKSFMVTTKPRCKSIVDDIASGKETLHLSDWKETMVARFGCPIKKDAT